jgi:hypothetical protein
MYRQLLTQQQQQSGSSTAAAVAGTSQAPDGAASQQQQQPGAPEEFTLPDGAKFTVTSEGYQVTEALFDPTLLGHHTPGDCVLQMNAKLLVLHTSYHARARACVMRHTTKQQQQQ